MSTRLEVYRGRIINQTLTTMPGNTSRRGFASMSPDKQREIASKGGHAAHAKGTAHEFTSEEAREAGRKGVELAVKTDTQPLRLLDYLLTSLLCGNNGLT